MLLSDDEKAYFKLILIVGENFLGHFVLSISFLSLPFIIYHSSPMFSVLSSDYMVSSECFYYLRKDKNLDVTLCVTNVLLRLNVFSQISHRYFLTVDFLRLLIVRKRCCLYVPDKINVALSLALLSTMT